MAAAPQSGLEILERQRHGRFAPRARELLLDEEAFAGRTPTSREAALGMEVQDLADQSRQALAQRTGIQATAIPPGVLVSSVDPLGPAADAGIPQGAIITRIGDRPIASIDDYRAHGGYESLRTAIELGPEAVIEAVTDAKLLGRGGAAFPTGVKWQAVSR